MKPIRIPTLNSQQLAALEDLYRTPRDARLRTRAQMLLLGRRAQRLSAQEIAKQDRAPKRGDREALGLKRYLAQGIEGLLRRDASPPGAPRKVTAECMARD